MLIKRRKCLADFIRGKETDQINKYTDHQEKVPTAPNIVGPYTCPAYDLTLPTRLKTVQRAIQEDIRYLNLCITS